MAQHEVKGRNGVIYIIPDDVLFRKYRSGEAYIDKYGRLMDFKTKRVIKELEQKSDYHPVSSTTPPTSPRSTKRTFRDDMSDEARRFGKKLVRKTADKGAEGLSDWLVYDVAPTLWYEKIIPALKRIKTKFIADQQHLERTLEAYQRSKSSSSAQIKAQPVIKQEAKTPMTDEEAAEEVARFIRHYIGMIRSLIKLRNAGRLDEVRNLLPQLTNPATIERFNGLLSSDQDLLKNSENNELKVLLGRDLYPDGKYAPINSDELECLAKIINSEE